MLELTMEGQAGILQNFQGDGLQLQLRDLQAAEGLACPAKPSVCCQWSHVDVDIDHIIRTHHTRRLEGIRL